MKFEPLAVALLLEVVACSSPFSGGTLCTEQFAAGITVSPIDSVTGAPVAGATAIARDGAFVDSTTDLNMIAGERAGTYSVTVRKTGYATWLRSGVNVTRDECHVKTVSLTAKLQPSP
jgi:hypothetical protein